ncbi:uncharacterized protein N7482_007880 [Penicillium canariense]|uniref:Amino acid permease/ SLC12A domain-containing protein n=1 Tax=Penicillium canariense TaxID=189055 RepID=A0A9W9LL03_9EURO|nr:uncharacterized protein N7482_007880 [Penicillium canariense]KAJ5160876.1 hypothetical protein N7482_007880 [Penicillium canariense]
MASNNSSSVDADEIFRALDRLPIHTNLNATRDDLHSTRTATTRGGTVELQQPAIPLTPQLSSMRSVSPQSVSPRAPVGHVSPVPTNDTIDYAHVTQDPRDRVVNQKLRGIHVFMITISGVLGAGLYVRSGSILRFGGPGAVLISTTVMGLLAWLVMQCIAEMLTLWPISGALVEYVGTFVDEDLGIAVGIAYWFTYAMSFAALIVAGAGVLDYWDPGKAIQGTVMFFLVPLFIIFFNSFGVQIYGLSEVIGGFLKIIGICVVIACMIAINIGAGAEGHIGTKYFKYDTIFPRDPATGDSWASVLFISFSTAAFAYVGVDITAATALEARPDSKRSQGDKSLWPAISVRFIATWTSFIIWIIYFLAGILLSFNVYWRNPSLPRASFLGSPVNPTDANVINSNSGFVISASLSQIHGLDDMVAAIILITVIFSANTNLYVASRALFVLARKIHGSECVYYHRDRINSSPYFARLRRFSPGAEDVYPWRSHGQPFTMYLALCGCLVVLVIANGAALWQGFLVPGFLSAYLAPLCFIVLWFGIKFLRWGSLKLHLEDLSDFEQVKLKFRYLDEIGQRAAVRVQPQQPRGWGNLWGLM